jgi:hypothetical protein
MQKFIVTILLAVSSFSFVGCRALAPNDPPEVPVSFYKRPYTDFTVVGRVVLLGLENRSSYPSIADDMTASLYEAVQKMQMFGLDVVYNNDPRWVALNLNTSGIFPEKQLATIRSELKTDAIMLGEVLAYTPYPRVTIQLRLKLIDCHTGHMLWAVEQVWDSTDRAVERRIKRYFKDEMRSGYDPLDWRLTLLSPRAFNKFVASEISKTIY